MSGGSSASGTTQYNWNDDMAPRWNNLLNFGLNTAFDIAGENDPQGRPAGSIHAKPRETYGGGSVYQGIGANNAQRRAAGYFIPGDPEYQGMPYDTTGRIAPLSPQQQEAQGYIQGMARHSSSPVGSMRDANGNIGLNPQTGQQWGGATNDARLMIEDTLGGRYLSGNQKNPYATNANQFMNQTTQTDRNIFGGDNPYFRQALNMGMDDITRQYQEATEPSLRAAAVLNGTLGGGDHLRAQANNEAALGKTLQNYATGMLNDQFNRSAGLEDSFLNRDIQNQQNNAARQSQLAESQLGRGFTGFENERGRQMGAIGMGQAEQGLAFDRANQLMNSGNMNRDYIQSLLSQDYGDWTQNQNHPYQLLQMLGGLYGQAMGSGAGLQTSMYGGQGSPALGAGLGLASLLL